MGICVFMIGAKGELQFSAENTWSSKGALVSGVPGPFIVLCGTVITIQVLLFTRVSYEEFGPGHEVVTTSASPAVSTRIASRTIASSEQAGLLAISKGAANALFALSHPDEPDTAVMEDLNFLSHSPQSVQAVTLDWDADAKRPRGHVHGRDGSPVEFGDDGVLFIPVLGADTEIVTQALERLSVAASDPRPMSPEAALRQIRAAMSGAVSYNPRLACQ